MATLYGEKNLEKIILKCKDENNYLDPNTMYDEFGNKLYAYVTLVMLGDLYTAAALVLAYSLRILKTKADLVVLVTHDVSESAKRVLKTYYDHVIEINYIEVKNWRCEKQPHRKYLNYVFTKFNLFNLTQYKKVLLIDADAIVLKYPDHLFSLNAPAGCYLKDKDLFITYDKDGNYILPPDNKIKWYNEFCACCRHGKVIPKRETDKVVYDRKNAGIGGGIMLLEPKKGELESIIKDVKTKSCNLVNKVFVWPEQQYLTYRYSGRWTSINPVFFGLQGYPHWKVLYGLQYGGDKPFVLQSKLPMEQRLEYPDYILWHDFFEKILQENTNLLHEEALDEPLEMHKLFKSRPLSNISRINLEILPDLKRDYFNKNIDVLFKNIQPFDYLKSMTDKEILYKYKNLLEDSVEHKKSLDSYVFDENIMDFIMFNYVSCRKSCHFVISWQEENFDALKQNLLSSGNVYYSKKIILSKNGIKNLIYILHDTQTRETRLDFINSLNLNEVNEINIFVFDNIYNLDIKLFKLSIGHKFVSYINEHFYQTITCAQTLLNKNSLHFLNLARFDRFINPIFDNAHNKINVYKQEKNQEKNNDVLVGDSVLYAYGIRPFETIKTKSDMNQNNYFYYNNLKFSILENELVNLKDFDILMLYLKFKDIIGNTIILNKNNKLNIKYNKEIIDKIDKHYLNQDRMTNNIIKSICD